MAEEKKSVLIVEDEQDLAEIIKSKLFKNGMTSKICSKVDETIAATDSEKFDLILLDLRIEQGSSEVVVQRLREAESNPNYATPILVVSGYVNSEVEERLGSKISGTVLKPFTEKTLMEEVKKVLN